jgi:serine/threonine protein kinase
LHTCLRTLASCHSSRTHPGLAEMFRAPSEALSPRSANLPMKPPAAIRKTKVDTRAKPAQSVLNPDKIDEIWRPAGIIREPGSEGDVYLIGKKLGRGGFAVCFEGRSERTRELLALKVVKSQVEQKKQLEKVALVSN